MRELKQDTPYQLFIKENDRQRALKIIKEGIDEYLPEDYFEEWGVKDFTKPFITSELCNTHNAITFNTFIDNLEELQALSVDGRSKDKIKVLFGVMDEDETFTDAEEILELPL